MRVQRVHVFKLFFLQVYNTPIAIFYRCTILRLLFLQVYNTPIAFFLQVYNTPIADVFLNVLQTLLQIEPDNPLR